MMNATPLKTGNAQDSEVDTDKRPAGPSSAGQTDA